MRLTSTGATCTPRLANVAYAEAMSTAVMRLVPRTADGTGSSGLRMPRSVATSMACRLPTSCISCTNRVLRLWTVPSTRSADATASPSE